MNDQNLPQPELPEDDEISLLDLATALGEEKQTLFGIPIVTSLLALVYALGATPIYTAKTTVAQSQSQSQSQSQFMAALLTSVEMQTTLAQQLNLQAHYDTATPGDTLAALNSNTRITVDKKSDLVHIEVDDPDPQFAATLANRHTDALQKLMHDLHVQRENQRLLFFSNQVAQLKTDPKKLFEVGTLARARLMDIVREKESEYAALRQSAADSEPILKRRITQLMRLNDDLTALEAALGQGHENVAAVNAVLNILSRQEEAARLDAIREPQLLRIIDKATPPEHKSKPKRAMIVVLAGVAGLFLGVLVAFIRRALKNAAQSPESAQQMVALKRAWTTGWKPGR